MKKNSVVYYKDGAVVRLHNRRISFKEINKKIIIKFDFADTEAEKPACSHICYKGKIRETFLALNTEAMKALVFAFINYKKIMEKNKNNKIKKL